MEIDEQANGKDGAKAEAVQGRGNYPMWYGGGDRCVQGNEEGVSEWVGWRWPTGDMWR